MNEKIFLEAKVNNNDLEAIIKNAGIQYPHESLGFFKAIFASVDDKPNRNGVRLAPSVKEQVGQLIGCQANFEHTRVNSICGTIIHAFVNKNEEIEIVFSFYKTVYPYEYKYALDLMANNELTVSFELRVAKQDVEELPDGTRRLHKVEFDGVGLLMENAPAYPNAHVYQHANFNMLREQDLVFAKCFKGEQMLQQFEGSHWTAKYINNLPDTSFAVIEPAYLEGKTQDKRARHLPYKDHLGNVNEAHYRFALRKMDKLQSFTDSITNEELIDKAQAVLNNVSIAFKNNEEELTVDKKANDAILAKFKEQIVAEFGDAVKDWTDEDFQNDEKIQSLKATKTEEVVEAKTEEVVAEPVVEVAKTEEVVEETKVEEVVVEEPVVEAKVEEVVAEPIVEDAKTVITTETVETIDENVEKIEVKKVMEVDDVKVLEVTETREVVYSQADVDAIKAEYEAKLIAKDNEIAEVKASAKQVAELRAELGDYVKDLTDSDLLNSDKVEIAKLKKLNDELKKASVEKTPSQSETTVLETGHDDTDDGTADVKAYIRAKWGKK